MAVLNNNTLAGSSGQTTGGGEGIERSLRFNSADSAYLSWQPTTSSSGTTWTFSTWVKLCSFSSNSIFAIHNSDGNTPRFGFQLVSTAALELFAYDGTNGWNLVTSQVFRDGSAWYHFVVVGDTTNATQAERVRLYVNGSRITNFSTSSFPAQNFNCQVGANSILHMLGLYSGTYGNFYLADVHLIDGQALDPTSFGEFDTNGVWQPKAYEGTYGTNGFHLPFSDNSTAAALGTDTSGNSNTWTVNNLSVNNGNGNYLSAGSYSFTGTQIVPLRNAYDGISGTSGGSTSGVTFWGIGDGTATHSGLSKSFTSGVRVFYNVNIAGGSISVNGSSKSAPVPPGGNTTVGVLDWTGIISSPFTSISITAPNNVVGVYVSGIEIDGVLLIDSTVNGANDDSLVDSPTNYGEDSGAGGEVRGNYCTWNPLTKGTYTNGNLDSSNTTYQIGTGTIGVSSGKWYWEVAKTDSGTTHTIAGITPLVYSTAEYLGLSANGYGLYFFNGNLIYNGSSSGAYGAFSQNDILNVALDLDNGKVWFGKNGTWFNSGNPAAGTDALGTGLTGTWYPGVSTASGTVTATLNAGQRPFAYTAPSGFKALCTTNLAEPTIADGSTAMDVALYTGNGSTQTISGLGFSPDFAWFKRRGPAAAGPFLFDQVRGAGKFLVSNSTGAEGDDSVNTLQSFNSDGYTMGDTGAMNESGSTYVVWSWDAGSSTVTNNDGSSTSQVRANASAGFSVVTYTGTGSAATVGHGLGVAPAFFVTKRRDSSSFGNWTVYHSSIGTQYLELNGTGAAATDSTRWSSAATSTVFNIGSGGNVNVSGGTFVAYCFAPVAGYSSFGSYTGNGSATDGPFVYTGHRSRFILLKKSSSAGGWYIYDTARSTYNAAGVVLQPHDSAAEFDSSAYPFDILSNGFKPRTSDSLSNQSGQTYIWASFAEHPFATARAR